MKIILQRETFLKPLQMVMGVVEQKQAMPILGNVLIIAEDNTVSLIATNTEVELLATAPLTQIIESAVSFTLPCRKLVDICRALPENSSIELTINPGKESVTLRSGRSRYTLATLPADEFPHIEQYSVIASTTLTHQTLRYLLQRTFFAMANQDIRYYLNGLLLEFSTNMVNAVATDGHRLAFNALKVPFNEQDPCRIIVPRNSVLELLRLLNNSVEEVRIEISSSNLRIVDNNFTFTAKLLEGRFPDYQQAIPRNGQKKIVLDRELFRQALSRSAILSNDKFRAVYFEFKQNLLRILANNQNKEFAEEELEIDYLHEELGVGFNVNYLLDVLSTIDTTHVILTISGLGDSILLEEPGSENSAFVIMPMRM